MSVSTDNKAIIFYKDWERYFKLFTNEDKGKLLTAIYDYATSGHLTHFSEKGLTVALEVFVSSIDRDNEKWVKKCEARAAAGRASAEKRRREKEKEQQATNLTSVDFVEQSLTNASDKDKDKVKDKDKEREKDINKKGASLNEAPTPDKKSLKSYGEFKHVFLTDEQFKKLVADFGEKKIAEYIRRVDEYIQQSGKSYRDFALTIRKWIYDDCKLSKSGGAEKGENKSLDISKIETLIASKYKS